WTYRNDGGLVGVPRPDAYGADFRREDFPLVSPQMDIYRGFVWGNLAPDGTCLADHLGAGGKKAIDLFCDASPEGEVILQQGCLKGEIYANWKFQGGDGYHAPIVHAANFGVMRKKRRGEKGTMGAAHTAENVLSRDLGNGHYCLDVRANGFGSALPDTAW